MFAIIYKLEYYRLISVIFIVHFSIWMMVVVYVVYVVNTCFAGVFIIFDCECQLLGGDFAQNTIANGLVPVRDNFGISL